MLDQAPNAQLLDRFFVHDVVLKEMAGPEGLPVQAHDRGLV